MFLQKIMLNNKKFSLVWFFISLTLYLVLTLSLRNKNVTGTLQCNTIPCNPVIAILLKLQ